jgi:serpin B
MRPLPEERLHPARGALLAAVNAARAFLPDGDAEPFTLRTINASWWQSGYPILEDYLDALSPLLRRWHLPLGLRHRPRGSRLSINDWIADQTEQRIEDLIPKGVITELTRLVLTNAIYFKAKWLSQFSPLTGPSFSSSSTNPTG